jgi:SAM-dependent methyltransferase
MLIEARRQSALAGVSLVHVSAGQALPFQPETFDAICFCSVLYLLPREEELALLRQAQALLRPRGRIVILTPSGAARVHFPTAWQHWTFYLWRRLTASAGRQWQALCLAADFAQQQGMAYTCHSAFSGMATLEVLTLQPTSSTR